MHDPRYKEGVDVDHPSVVQRESTQTDVSFDIEAWSTATLECLELLTQDLLGLEHCPIIDDRHQTPAEVHGAYVPLNNGQSVVQVGIFSNKDGVRRLARALLQMEEDEIDPDPAEIADAVGEIANVLAGAAKARREDIDANLNLGSPVVVDGDGRALRNIKAKITRLYLAGIPIFIAVASSTEDNPL